MELLIKLCLQTLFYYQMDAKGTTDYVAQYDVIWS